MHKKIFPFTAMAMAMAAAAASNPYFMTIQRYRQQRDDAIRRRREDDAAMRALKYECRKEYEFCIHGERIMAHDRKTALKIYNRRHPEKKRK